MRAYLFAYGGEVVMFAILFGGGLFSAITLIIVCKVLKYLYIDGEKNGWFRF